MATPTSETDIRNLLQLDAHAVTHPAPKPYFVEEWVIDLDGITYAREAIDAALKDSDDDSIRELLEYHGKILKHNNVGGHGSVGDEISVIDAIRSCASKETMERIARIQTD